jgi:hypothetical protein
MHPELMHRADLARRADLRREAEDHRRSVRLLGGRTRQASPAIALPASIHRVLIVTERSPSRAQVDHVLSQLRALREEVVTALFHQPPPRLASLLNESGSHSLSLPLPDVRIPAQRVSSEMERECSDVMATLRAAGHEAHGELVAGPLSRLVVHEIRERQPDAVILVTGRHRLARLTHRDLEHRVRSATSGPVVSIREGCEPLSF